MPNEIFPQSNYRFAYLALCDFNNRTCENFLALNLCIIVSPYAILILQHDLSCQNPAQKILLSDFYFQSPKFSKN